MTHRVEKFRLSLVILAVFVCLLVQGCGALDAQRGNPLKPVEEMTLDARVGWYTSALKTDPNNAELLIQLNNARHEASMDHLKKAKALIQKRFYREAISQLQMSIAFYPANTRAVELITLTKRVKSSLEYFQKGDDLIRQGDHIGALVSFRRAIKLDPENHQARNALKKYDKHPVNFLSGVNFKSRKPITIKLKKTPIIEAFEVLSKISGINFVFDKDIRNSQVTLFMTGVALENFFKVLLKTSDLAAKSVDENTLMIYPDTLAKAKTYDELYVKTFYLSYLAAKDALSIISKIFRTKELVANESLNAITVRGRKADLEMAGKLIRANDLAPSEVVLNVEILEVSRSKEKNLGLSFSDSITMGISETSTGIQYSSGSSLGFANIGSIYDIGNITNKELYLSLPTATLNLLKQDSDTRILAKPSIRVKNHAKASILIGERVPLRSNRKVQTDGSITYDFQYQDVGIKFNAEPVITTGNLVNLNMGLEVSSLGTNVGSVDDPQYAIRTKSASTVLTINDGDTVILGGLIQNEERETIKKIPLLGDIPAVGRLFTSRSNENVETDILMTITPVVIRSRGVPEKGVTGFWSGSMNSPSTQVPFGQTNTAGEIRDGAMEE